MRVVPEAIRSHCPLELQYSCFGRAVHVFHYDSRVKYVLWYGECLALHWLPEWCPRWWWHCYSLLSLNDTITWYKITQRRWGSYKVRAPRLQSALFTYIRNNTTKGKFPAMTCARHVIPNVILCEACYGNCKVCIEFHQSSNPPSAVTYSIGESSYEALSVASATGRVA